MLRVHVLYCNLLSENHRLGIEQKPYEQWVVNCCRPVSDRPVNEYSFCQNCKVHVD